MQEKLIIARKRNNINQETLAKLVNITVKQYGQKERGQSIFNGDEMFAIAEYFGVKVEDLFLPTNHQNGDITCLDN